MKSPITEIMHSMKKSRPVAAVRHAIKRPIAVVLLLCLITPWLAACAPKQQIYQYQFFRLFDTVTIVMGYDESQEAFNLRAKAVEADLEVYHQLYDIYYSYDGVTNIRDLNKAAGQGPVKVDSRIIDLLEEGKYANRLTQGKVNIAMGAVLRIWHDYRTRGTDNPEKAELPKMADLEAANEHVSIDDLVIDRANSTVELKDPAMSLDVGAIAKGYATEQVALLAEARGEKHLLISCGGNVRAIGARNDAGDPWKVGIENPIEGEDQPAYVTATAVVDGSVVTSGLYARYYIVDGKRYHHIIDPVTLFPEDRFLSVSIYTHDSGLADILSTALYNSSIEEGKSLVESLPGTEVLWILMDGTMVRSSGFASHEIEQ